MAPTFLGEWSVPRFRLRKAYGATGSEADTPEVPIVIRDQ